MAARICSFITRRSRAAASRASPRASGSSSTSSRATRVLRPRTSPRSPEPDLPRERGHPPGWPFPFLPLPFYPGLVSSVQRSFLSLADLPEPIREELWGVERLDQHAVHLAGVQKARPGRRGDPRLAPRVRDNSRVLLDCYRTLAEAIRGERTVTPAAEWLVDNFHLVEEQLREIREDLPPGFYRELPRLVDGPLRGYPRVYAIAYQFVAHTDSLFDAEALRRFVRAYQSGQPLTIGELWALVISLRVVLVENLRRLAERMVHARMA